MKLEKPPDAVHAIARTGAEPLRKPAGRKGVELIAEFLPWEEIGAHRLGNGGGAVRRLRVGDPFLVLALAAGNSTSCAHRD